MLFLIIREITNGSITIIFTKMLIYRIIKFLFIYRCMNLNLFRKLYSYIYMQFFFIILIIYFINLLYYKNFKIEFNRFKKFIMESSSKDFFLDELAFLYVIKSLLFQYLFM